MKRQQLALKERHAITAKRNSAKFLQLILGQQNGRVTERSIGTNAPLPDARLRTMKLLVQVELQLALQEQLATYAVINMVR